jgi:homoserine dehydrogenase
MAFQLGMHVVTANKGPIVYGFKDLSKLASSYGTRFLFESTVMDGTPIFSTFRTGLPVSKVQSFRGVLNSTSNAILDGMEQGKTLKDGVRYAQELGVAEADAANDIDGWDAAIKTAVLATVLMDCHITPMDVVREGIRNLTVKQVQKARADGTPIKLLCTAEQKHGSLLAVVRPTPLSFSDPLSHLDGTSTGVSLYIDTMKEIVIAGMYHGPEQTAFGLLADFVNVVRGE